MGLPACSPTNTLCTVATCSCPEHAAARCSLLDQTLVRGNDFQSDERSQHGVLRQVHRAHTPAADLPDDHEPAALERVAGFEGATR